MARIPGMSLPDSVRVVGATIETELPIIIAELAPSRTACSSPAKPSTNCA